MMKSIKILTILFISVLAFNANAQKVKFKKGKVLIDKQEWLTYDGCGMFNATCSLYNNNDDEIVFIKLVSVPGIEPVTSANKDGSLDYYEVIFLGKDKKFEILESPKKIVKMLYKSKAVNSNGELNMEKVDRLIEKHGTTFSDRLNKTTITIKQESSKKDDSGINIKIGN